ncbi:MAG: hypothetical protein ACI35O_16725 [Bacillaceae bacterium]
MRITLLELQKVFRSPFLLLLMVIFIGFNIFFIVSNAHWKDELKVVNKIVNNYGLTFNDETLKQMESDINDKLTSIDKTQSSAEKFFTNLTSEKYEAYDLKKQKEIDELSLFYMYHSQAISLDERYYAIDIKAIGEDTKKMYHITSTASNWIDTNFNEVEKRFNKLIEDEEYKSWFFAADPYRMHSHLFRSIMKMIVVEGALMVVLLSAYIACFERDNRTSHLTFSTKIGRTLMVRKWFASLFGTTLAFSILVGITLVTYFTVYDYSGLWNVPITSGLNWEYNLPYVTWWKLSFLSYLLLVILIIFITLLLISTLTFALSIFVRSSYITAITTYLLLVFMSVIPGKVSFSPILLLISHFNLSLLLLNPHMYFNGLSGLTGFKYHEIGTLFAWTIIILVVLKISFVEFQRKDIH